MEMKKYLGMVKVETECMAGMRVELRVKFSDDKAYIEQWMKLYPNCDKLIFDNTPELDAGLLRVVGPSTRYRSCSPNRAP